MTQSAFVPTQFVVQLANNFQPPQWGAPALICGVQVVVDGAGNPLYQPAYQQRPVGAVDFTPEILESINHQLKTVGLVLSKVEE